MAFKVKVGLAEVEAETAEDVKNLLAVIGALPSANGHAHGIDPNEPIPERLKKIRARIIRQDQRDALRALAQSEDGLTDRQLGETLGLKDNHALGAIMQALSKHAKAVGLDLSRVLTKRMTKTDGGRGRAYLYRLTPEMRDIMKERMM